MILQDMPVNSLYAIQQKFIDYVVLSGKYFQNMMVILAMKAPYDFAVLYTTNQFMSFTVHRYRTLKEAFNDYDNAYIKQVL